MNIRLSVAEDTELSYQPHRIQLSGWMADCELHSADALQDSHDSWPSEQDGENEKHALDFMSC